MEANDINKDIIGKKCQCYMLGDKTNGVISDIEGETVKITFDEPIMWGKDIFNYGWFYESQLKYITITEKQ